MYLSIDYHNGKSSFTYTIDSENPPDGVIEKAIGAFLECVYPEQEEELTEYEFSSDDVPDNFPDFPDFLFSVVQVDEKKEDLRKTLYGIADEIVESYGEDNG